ncbi:MAG: glycosyltransferase family 39 protein [Caldilineaceae bacterium]
MTIDRQLSSTNLTPAAVNRHSLISNLQFLFVSPIPEATVLLLALITRCWQLNYHSIWFDEAVSLRWASADPSYIWQKTFPLVEEKHPPVYYIGLHFWQKLIGLVGLAHNDVALRLFGSLLGVLTVWGIMLLARQVQPPPGNRTTSLLTGLLVAFCPVLIWYSQELRMFQPATTAIVWASYCLVRAWQAEISRQRIGWWLGFLLVMEAALYSYLFSAFTLPAAGLTLLGLALTSLRVTAFPHSTLSTPHLLRRFGEGVVAIGLTGLLFLPLAYNALTATKNESTPGHAFANFGQTIWRLLKIFTVWRVGWPAPLTNGAVALFGLFLVIGILWPQLTNRKGREERKEIESEPLRSSRPLRLNFFSQSIFLEDRIWLWVWIGAPLLIGNLLLSRDETVFAEDRYFIFMAPFILWAVARGIVLLGQRWRAVGWISGLMTIGLLTAALPRLWTPAMYRENWRAASNYITAYQQASPDLSGAIVTHVDYTHEALEWYLRQQLSQAQLPVYFPYGGALAPDQVDTVIAPPLLGIVKTGAATLWLTQSHLAGVDDQYLVENWLNQNFPEITEQYPNGIKLVGYALQSRFTQLPTLPTTAVKPAKALVKGLTLAACELLTPRLAAYDAQMHPPSGWVHVRLWWQATDALGDDYIATAQMVGPEGVWGDRLYRGNEALRRWPTHTWAIGDIVRDEVDINLNPVTPNGEYPVVIGVMDGKGQSVGDKVECGRVTIKN